MFRVLTRAGSKWEDLEVRGEGNHENDAARKRNLGREFRTCAVSYAGGKGTVLACIDWGYYIDAAGNVSFYPAKPTAYTGAVSEALDAAKRWDGDAANTKANIDK